MFAVYKYRKIILLKKKYVASKLRKHIKSQQKHSFSYFFYNLYFLNQS